MSFGLTKPGGWSFGELLTSPQVEDIDLKTANAVDGVGGGSYSPSSQISIGGKGLAVSGPLNVSGTATLTGNVSIGNGGSDTLAVDAEVTFSQDIEFTNDVRLGDTDTDAIDVDGVLTCSREATFEDGVDVTGNSEITGNLDITGAVTVSSDLAVGDDLTVADKLQVNGNTTLGSSSSDELTINAQLANRLRFSGLGRIAFRAGTLSDANQTLSVADGNCFHIPRDNTAVRTYTLSTANAMDGDFALFYTGANNEGIPAKEVVIGASDQGYRFDDDHNSQFVLFVFEDGDWWQAITSTFI